MNHIDAVAIRKCAREGFTPYSFEVLDVSPERYATSDTLVKLGKERILSRGPRKGKKTWDTKNHQVVVVTHEEEQGERRRYRAETGNCDVCMGSGQTLKSWHHIDGATYRPCASCQGSGKVSEVQS